MAARRKNASIVKLLLEAGACPSASDGKGKSCLHHSVEISSVENTRLLLEAGAQLEAQDLDGETPLHSAACLNQSVVGELMDLLLMHGANANARNKSGVTCFHLAVQFDQPYEPESRFQILVEHGAKVEARDFNGNTALHYAAWRVNVRALDVLLAWHKDQGTLQNALEARDEYGCTALHCAANSTVRGSPAVKLLLDYEAPVGARDFKGNMPLHLCLMLIKGSLRTTTKDNFPKWAKEWDCGHQVVMLLNAGADPLAENNTGTTPRDIVRRDKSLASFLEEFWPECRPLGLLCPDSGCSHTEAPNDYSTP